MGVRDERDIWLDALRGIAIVLVVIGHALRGLGEAGAAGGAVLEMVDARLYAVHVPLLFFVSGVLVMGSLDRRGAGPFAGSRFAVLLAPMVIWTYVFLGVKLLAGSNQNDPITWEALLISPIPGQLHLWFLWALFLMHMLFAALWAAVPSRALPAAPLAVFAVSLLTAWTGLPDGSQRWIGGAVDNLPYFSLGVLFGLRGVRSQLAAGPSLLAAACALAAVLLAPQIEAATGFGAVPSLLACVGVYFSATLLLRFHGAMAVCAYLGVSSMAIYVLHTIFSAGIREALLAAHVSSLGTHILLGVVAGVLLPILLREISLRVGVARPLALA